MRHTKLTVASHVPAATHPRRTHQVSLRTCTTHRAQRVQRGSTQTATPTRTALAAPTAKSSLPLCRRRALPATRTFLTLVDQRSARRAARGRCSRRQGRLCAWCAQRVASTPSGCRAMTRALLAQHAIHRLPLPYCSAISTKTAQIFVVCRATLTTRHTHALSPSSVRYPMRKMRLAGSQTPWRWADPASC